MIIMTPWTWAIAHRRFNQGVLIRFGQSKAVGWGTLVRLIADVTVLFTCYTLAQSFDSPNIGIIAATAAVSAGVVAEAAYAAWRVRPIVRDVLPGAKSSEPPLDRKQFLSFYVPLALSPLLGLAAQPVLTAGISRMPSPTESLAILPAVNGFTFLFRSVSLRSSRWWLRWWNAPAATLPFAALRARLLRCVCRAVADRGNAVSRHLVWDCWWIGRCAWPTGGHIRLGSDHDGRHRVR